MFYPYRCEWCSELLDYLFEGAWPPPDEIKCSECGGPANLVEDR